jgi:hypothetical protein
MNIPTFQLFRLRRGLVVWQKDFSDRSEALDVVAKRGRPASPQHSG